MALPLIKVLGNVPLRNTDLLSGAAAVVRFKWDFFFQLNMNLQLETKAKKPSLLKPVSWVNRACSHKPPSLPTQMGAMNRK